MSFWASQAHAFHQPVCQRLFWLHHWSVPHVHTIEVFSPSEWGPDPQCQAAEVAHWTWWWQCVAAWDCRSVWSLPCHFAADAGGSALSMAKSRWHGALRFAHKSCTHGHVFWKRGGVKRGLVADPWTSSRQFSHVFHLKVKSHLLLRACLLGSKRKLPPQACQVRPGLPSVVCHPREVQFPGTVYIYSQGPFSSAWARCISCAPSACSHCRRCCCCQLQCDRQRMETRLNSARGPVPYRITASHYVNLARFTRCSNHFETNTILISFVILWKSFIKKIESQQHSGAVIHIWNTDILDGGSAFLALCRTPLPLV